MPAFDVTIEGKTYHVEVPDPGATPLIVVVDGQMFAVNIEGTETTAKPVQLAEPPRPAPQPPHLPAPPRIATARPAASAATAGQGNGGAEIIAPMPGTILGINVSVGQAVEAGDVLCVLEAMKMKNQLRATHAGTVSEIIAQAGQTVAYGDVLIRLA